MRSAAMLRFSSKIPGFTSYVLLSRVLKHFPICDRAFSECK